MNKFVYGVGRLVRLLLKPFFPRTVFGSKKLPKKRTIVVGNHLCGWDAIMMYITVKTHINYVYKAEFEKSSFLHGFFNGMGFVPIRRGEADIQGTKRCLSVLKNNDILGIFPEGTRNPRVDCLQEFKTGTALFALKTKTPIRPFYIWDKTLAFRRNYIMIGQEFTLEQFYGKPITQEVLREATQIIYDKMDALRIELNEILAKRGVKRRKRTKKELQKLAQFEANCDKQTSQDVNQQSQLDNSNVSSTQDDNTTNK